MRIRPLAGLVFAALFLEVGLVLILVPWSVVWERNFFLDLFPSLAPFLQSNFTRGAVSGLGVVNICAGFIDLATLMLERYSPWPRSEGGSSITPREVSPLESRADDQVSTRRGRVGFSCGHGPLARAARLGDVSSERLADPTDG